MFADIIHNQIFYVLISIQNKKSSIIIIQVMWTNCLHWEFGLTLKYLQSCFCFLWFVNFKSVRITLSVGNEMPQLVNCGLNFVVDITAKFPNSKSKKKIKNTQIKPCMLQTISINTNQTWPNRLSVPNQNQFHLSIRKSVFEWHLV